MSTHFALSLAIAGGLSMFAAVAATSLLFRFVPALIGGLQRLGFLMILAAGAEAAMLLFGSAGAGDSKPAVARIVLVLAVGLAIYLESGHQIIKQRRSMDLPKT